MSGAAAFCMLIRKAVTGMEVDQPGGRVRRRRRVGQPGRAETVQGARRRGGDGGNAVAGGDAGQPGAGGGGQEVGQGEQTGRATEDGRAHTPSAPPLPLHPPASLPPLGPGAPVWLPASRSLSGVRVPAWPRCSSARVHMAGSAMVSEGREQQACTRAATRQRQPCRFTASVPHALSSSLIQHVCSAAPSRRESPGCGQHPHQCATCARNPGQPLARCQGLRWNRRPGAPTPACPVQRGVNGDAG